MAIEGFFLEAHWWWLIAAIVLGIAELLAPGFFLMWLAVAALVGAVTAALGLSMLMQAILFAAAAVVAVYVGRRWVGPGTMASPDPLLNDRAARLVGDVVEVVQPILGGTGRVKVGDGVWNASGPDTPLGARVRVTGARGTTLLVEPLE